MQAVRGGREKTKLKAGSLVQSKASTNALATAGALI